MAKLDFDRLRADRAERPELVAHRLRSRRRRPLLVGDGKLMIIAADHTARGVSRTGSRAEDMLNRYDLLERLSLALSRPGVDGVLATPDILDDLALLGALDGKVVLGTVNRAGLANSSFELDDRLTSYDAASIVRSRLDGAKLLVRLCLNDDRTAGMLAAAARIVDEMAAAQVPILLEPFLSRWENGLLVNDLGTESVSQAIAIVSALGGTSAYSWLKIPVVLDMERVMSSTTLPCLLLGGDSKRHPDATYDSWSRALALPGVRGLVVGRSLLYPDDGDVAVHVDIAAGLVHGPHLHDTTTASHPH
ncbi:MAG: deoxyribose-phosphate aldolase [Dermatophilaceae bacterium]